MKKIKQLLPLIVMYCLGIVFSIKAIHEPDTWWQLRIGEWILQNKKIPNQDVFSSSMYGIYWVNIKWGYEVIIAIIEKFSSPECIFIFQIFITVSILWILKKILNFYSIANYEIVLCSAILFLIINEFRINGRPESISWLFSLLFIYILLKPKNNKLIYCIPLLQILWCNLHEAYGIGVVIVFLFFISNLLEVYFYKNTINLKIIILLIACLIAVCINPYGTKLLLKPFEIFTQLQTNKYTTELNNIFSAEYWIWQSVLFWIVIVGIVFNLIYTKYINKILKQFSIFYILCVVAFTILAVLAVRNIPFATLLWLPLFGKILNESFLVNPKKIILFQKIILISSVVLYFLVISNTYYKNTKSHDIYGMQFYNISIPQGGSAFIKNNNVSNKKVFADYLTSSYLMWDLQPNFKTFIDFRDLDVFTDSFFNNYLQLINNSNSFLQFVNNNKYDYVLLYRNEYPQLHAALFNDTLYACKYVDAVCAVYEKTDTFESKDIFSITQQSEINPIAYAINKIFNPLFEPQRFDSINYNLLAANYYIMVYKFDIASKIVNSILLSNPDNKEALYLLQQINNRKK